MKHIHYFGIRHHGPGSSQRLVQALDALQPKRVLIEGPSDCSELLPLLAHQQMKPPVALVSYASDNPECHFYYPFATFSPEYQACLWAVNHGAEVAFIDVPMAIKLANQIQKNEEANESLTETDEPSTKSEEPENQTLKISQDPIGALAQLAGYEDGESWWNDLVEQSLDEDTAVFVAVAKAMNALRQSLHDEQMIDSEDEIREAYMRQEIHRLTKDDTDDVVTAVVCGAWHIPALDLDFALLDSNQKPIKYSSKQDTALIKTLPKKLAASKIKSTWIPWTSARLSNQHYGAGVPSPMWYEHLWQNRNSKQQAQVSWLAKVTNALRQKGHIVSTASVIEAVRLAQSLAAVRVRASVSFEELTEAVVACLCFGERVLWQELAEDLLLGHKVGVIPDNTPLTPLLEDLQRQQKQTKLSPEALVKEISLDLRSEIGLKKSHLLHRLNILGVPWGELLDFGNSRGTFREKWQLQWQPEFAVMLMENLVYGNTIYEACHQKTIQSLKQITDLADLTEKIQTALQAGLDKAGAKGIEYLSLNAAHSDNALAMIKSIAPLVHLQRYGTARKMALDKIGDLVFELTIKAAIALPYAIKNISNDEASIYQQHIESAHKALNLTADESLIQRWWQAFDEIINSFGTGSQYHFTILGQIVRLSYQAERIDAEQLNKILQKTLSPAIQAEDAAKFFEGFFAESVEYLIYDKMLLNAIQVWILGLQEQEFIEFLPLFRRVFSVLDSGQRKRLLDTIFGQNTQDRILFYREDLSAIWQQHAQILTNLLPQDAP